MALNANGMMAKKTTLEAWWGVLATAWRLETVFTFKFMYQQ